MTFIKVARFTLVVALMAVPLAARAQSSSAEKQARALQVEGLHLMEKGDNRGALEKFEEAYKLVQSPRVLFNRAKAHHALGDDVEALTDFERFLDEAPYAPKESRSEAKRVVAELQPKLAYLDIHSDEADVEITVDGHSIGTTPIARPIVVQRGSHVVKGTKADMNEDVRPVSVIPGQKLRVVMKLTPVEKTPVAPVAPPPVAAVPPAPAPAPAAPESATPGATPAEPGTAPSGERPWQYTAGWIAAGAGALFLGTGIAFQVLSSSKGSEFNSVKDANGNPKCSTIYTNDGGSDCQTIADSAHQRQVIAIAGFVAAGVAVAGSVVLFLSGSSSQHAGQHDVAAICSPSTSGVSCALALRF